jgi:hypothetical protein
MTDGTTSGTTALSHADAEALRGTAKWARFLAIVNFVFLGLMLIFGIFAGSMMSKMGSMAGAAQEAQMEQMRQLQEQMQGSGMEGVDLEAMQNAQESMGSGAMAVAGTMYTIIILIAVAIAFFPTLMLYQFGSRTLKALSGPADAAVLTSGLNAHRRYYKFAGILMIIALCFMALGLLFGGLGAMMM